MKMQEQIPKQIEEISKKVKVMWLGNITEEKDPWQNIIGKIKVGKKVHVEDLLKEKGFEDAG